MQLDGNAVCFVYDCNKLLDQSGYEILDAVAGHALESGETCFMEPHGAPRRVLISSVTVAVLGVHGVLLDLRISTLPFRLRDETASLGRRANA